MIYSISVFEFAFFHLLVFTNAIQPLLGCIPLPRDQPKKLATNTSYKIINVLIQNIFYFDQLVFDVIKWRGEHPLEQLVLE